MAQKKCSVRGKMGCITKRRKASLECKRCNDYEKVIKIKKPKKKGHCMKRHREH